MVCGLTAPRPSPALTCRYDAIISACGPMFNVTGGACNTALRQASTEVGNINTYNIYGNW